jgi:hypothetical protein
MLYLMTIRYLNNPVTGQGDFLFPVGNDEIVDTAMLYLMTIRYLNSPVTGQGDFLFPISSDVLPVFLKLPQNNLIPIYIYVFVIPFFVN